MSLTTSQKQRLLEIDVHAKRILFKGGEEALLLALYDFMGDLKKIMDTSTQQELDEYCRYYDGFYCCMKLLENLARDIRDRKIAVPSLN